MSLQLQGARERETEYLVEGFGTLIELFGLGAKHTSRLQNPDRFGAAQEHLTSSDIGATAIGAILIATHGRISVGAASDSVFSPNSRRVWPLRLSGSAAAVDGEGEEPD